MPLFPLLLVAHIALAVSLFVPAFLLPFTFRQQAAGRSPGPFVRTLLWFQARGSWLVGAGLVVTGLGMVVLLGPAILSQPWLIAALVLYALNLIVAFFIQRPSVRRLLSLGRGDNDAERERWRAIARRQRYLSYVMAAGVGLIAFLMSTKPQLW